MRILRGLIIGLLALTSAFVAADNIDQSTKSFDDYLVHYSVFNSKFIPQAVAEVHQLVRADDRVLINIALQKRGEPGTVPAQVSGRAVNLMQQSRNLDFQAIREPDAFYSLASLRHTNEESMHFYIEVQPADSEQTLSFKFTRKLYTE